MANSQNKLSSPSMESVVNELHCPVCLEYFTYPIILPCSHILCRSPCAERLFNDEFVKCPVCRENSGVTGGLSNLPRVISLENIIETYRNAEKPQAEASVPDPDTQPDPCGPDDIPCQLCESVPNKAKSSCLDCNASYCRACLKLSHPHRDPFIRHQLVAPRKYAKPNVQMCPHHNAQVNIFCHDCSALGCVLCADDPNAHPNHKILSIKEAQQMFQTILEENLRRLEQSQGTLVDMVRTHRARLDSFQEECQTKRERIVSECESIKTEIESKKEFFISDLDYEQTSKTEGILERIDSCEKQTENVCDLMHYTKEVLKEEDLCAFIQLAKAVESRASEAFQSKEIRNPTSPTPLSVNQRIVDLRKEKSIIKDINYLSVPRTPVIDATKCSRSVHSVVIVLCSPLHEYDVIDEYRVYFSTDEQMEQGVKDTMIFNTPGEERKYSRGPVNLNAVCLIHDNLQSDTMYHFTVRAVNLSGESDVSGVVSCTTLAERQSSLPVPVILVSQCRAYSGSIQIHSPSPADANLDSINFYLLYREADANKIWKSIVLSNRSDHRVFGLQADTVYDFVIMACEESGECQVSTMISVATEASA